MVRRAAATFHAHPGSLEHFLTERYCLYTTTRKRLYRGDIHHLPWELQAAQVEMQENTMAQTTGLEIGPQPDLAFFRARAEGAVLGARAAAVVHGAQEQDSTVASASSYLRFIRSRQSSREQRLHCRNRF